MLRACDGRPCNGRSWRRSSPFSSRALPARATRISSDAAAPGLIVFASDRAKSNPGEIYSLAPGTAPRSVSRSLAADYALAVAPAGGLIAFWSYRGGADRLYLARADGSHLRRVAGVGEIPSPGSTGVGKPPVFSADGARLFASDSTHTVVIDTRRGTARELPFCASPQPSPDGLLVACGANGRTRVSTLAGTLRFSFPGAYPVWSSRGDVTNVPQSPFMPPPPATAVYDRSGRSLGRVRGQPLGWSPDGRFLVFARGKSLRVAGPGDFARSRLLLAGGQPGAVSFTPDSRSVSTADVKGRRLLIPLAGGRPLRGLDGGTGVWSRDGRLAYADDTAVARSGGRPGSLVSVRVTDTHGRNPRVVGRFPFDPQAPASTSLRWLPGGGRVLYSTVSRCSGSGLYAVPSAGGPARPLTADPRDLQMPTWAPVGGASPTPSRTSAASTASPRTSRRSPRRARGAGS